MSSRGIKHLYSVGENILCFEPDPTKARVLYNAKILEATVTKDKDGSRAPAYHVHFLGWKKIWDRVVPESFLLKDDAENRILMKKLAEATKRYRDNKARNRYINNLLQDTTNEQLNLMGQSSGSEDEHDIGEDSDNNVIEEESDENNDQSQEDADSVDGSVGNNTDDKTKIQEVNIEIPEILKEILEEEFVSINIENMVLRLPAKLNIVNILEGFVKSFTLNHLCSLPDKRNADSHSHTSFERNFSLCKELADGLRICFDHTLPLILLYKSEKEQYQNILKKFHYEPDSGTKTDSLSSPLLRTSLSATKTSSNGESSPKIPKLSPKIFKKEKIDYEMEKPNEICSRRLTRQTLQDSARKTQNNSTDVHKPCTELEKQVEHTPLKKMRRRRRSEIGNLAGVTDSSESPVKNQSDCLTSRRNDVPPPLLLPNSSSASVGGRHGSSSSSNDASDPHRMHENATESVLSWQLIPDSIAAALKPSPSMIYGAHHLLRLFVKLPDLILGMKMEDSKLQVLMDLLEKFLQYMVEKKADLFLADSYVNG